MTDVDSSRIEREADAVAMHLLRRGVTYPLVSKRGQVEVVAALAAGPGEADQLGAVRTGLAVVFHKVGTEVHAVFIPLG